MSTLAPDPVVTAGPDTAGPDTAGPGTAGPGTAEGSALHASMAAVARVMAAGPHDSPRGPRAPRPGAVRVGVDLGTAYTVLVVLDGAGEPLAGAYEPADVVRDGVVTDFIGAVDLLRGLKGTVERRLGFGLTSAHGAYPPGVAQSEVRAVAHVIEAADMDCSGLVDERSAANEVLGLSDGVVVDVGGGTTGIAVVVGGRVVLTADEPTGGTHLSLVIAGALGISVEEAEHLKKDPAEQRRLLPLVRPVMEKVASIVMANTGGWPVPRIYLVGGSVAFPGFAEAVAEASGLDAVVPVHPLFVTPLGIARSAPAHPVSG